MKKNLGDTDKWDYRKYQNFINDKKKNSNKICKKLAQFVEINYIVFKAFGIKNIYNM